MQRLQVHRNVLVQSEHIPDLAYLIGPSGHLMRAEPARPTTVATAKDWCFLADIRTVAPAADTITIGIVPMREVPDYWDREDLDVIIVHQVAYGPVQDGKRLSVRGTLVTAPNGFADLNK